MWTRGSAIRRAGYAGFTRNVAVAVLREALEREEPLVREHAGWALERTGIRGASGP